MPAWRWSCARAKRTGGAARRLAVPAAAERPDGTPNAYRIVRLKDKLGTESMASGEMRLDGATAFLVGEPEAGFRQMADMVNASRLSNGMRAAGLMRRAVTEALFVARHRIAFGRRIVEMPLMRRQSMKLALPMEQARSMVFQAAEALRRADAGEDGAYALLRILTPLLKFRACRDARRVTGDAMEVRGGCGYIEEWADPRLLRDSHLGSIWEGTSNIVALDVLRAAQREGSLPVLRAHVAALLGNGAALPEALPLFDRAASLAERAQENPALARQAASALYHLTSAAAMAWEAERLGDPDRLALAQLVVRHRVLPRDPLADADEAVAEFPARQGTRHIEKMWGEVSPHAPFYFWELGASCCEGLSRRPSVFSRCMACCCSGGRAAGIGRRPGRCSVSWVRAASSSAFG